MNRVRAAVSAVWARWPIVAGAVAGAAVGGGLGSLSGWTVVAVSLAITIGVLGGLAGWCLMPVDGDEEDDRDEWSVQETHVELSPFTAWTGNTDWRTGRPGLPRGHGINKTSTPDGVAAQPTQPSPARRRATTGTPGTAHRHADERNPQ